MAEADIDYRTWGATRTCKGCRYWSEMVAQSIGGGPVQASSVNTIPASASNFFVMSSSPRIIWFR